MKNIEVPRQDFDMYVARPDTKWIEREESDSLEKLYGLGFLPYSGAVDVDGVFYSARSARVVLPQFELTSENKRIAKKFDGQFTKETISGPPGEEAFDFCLAYFAQKHGERAMPRERLMQVFKNVTHTSVYRTATDPVAYVVSVEGRGFAHYWFSFYDLTLVRQSLGLWLMLDAIRDAKAHGLEHYYLGTVYGAKALYKTNFEPLEWWDGGKWNNDVSALKALSRED